MSRRSRPRARRIRWRRSSRDGVDLGGVGQLLRRDLVAHGGDAEVLRADEGDAFVFQRFAKASFSDRKP
jgi:hypothetical protein